MNKRKIIVQSINSLKEWLMSSEGIFILLSGGYERTFRDKLMYQIQTNLKKGVAISERTLRKKRPDILIVEDVERWQEMNTVIELKINSISQKSEITGKRLLLDFNKWAGKKNRKPIYFIFLIVDVKEVEESFRKFFNYLPNGKKGSFNYSDIKNHFDLICKNYKRADIQLLPVIELSQKISNPFNINLDLYLNIFEMTNK